MKNNKGMTVIELLITLALFGILITITLNITSSGKQRAQFDSALNRFVADYSYARMLAARENRYVAFVFDNDLGNSYTMVRQNKIGDDLSLTDSYTTVKTVRPLDGDRFYDNCTSFSLNSSGLIQNYPVTEGSQPIGIQLHFYFFSTATKKNEKKTLVRIFPTGGIKIEKED